MSQESSNDQGSTKKLAAQQQAEAVDSADQFVETDPPPVTRIVLFNSGLSQIVHEGTVENNQKVGLKFSAHDVDDVLKSLVFEDQSGGVVRSVEYKPAPDNQDVAARNLGPAMTLAQTLQKFRGEEVTIETKNKLKVTGNILSVENRQVEDQFVETLIVNNEIGFLSIALSDFDSVQFQNEKLREEFELAMAGLSKSRQANLKQLDLLFQGKGERKVRFSYNVDAPIWRMTYRLDLTPGKSTLQGWAHIDNVTGVDWKMIELDLRSGRPQSFHVDLFAPVLAERTAFGLDIFDIPSDKSLVPQWFGFEPPARMGDDSHGGFGGGGFGGGGFGGADGTGGLGGGTPFGGPAKPPKTKGMNINSAFRMAANADRSNKMVRFKIKDPVSLGAGRSAMVPVLNTSIPVSLYSMFDVGASEFADLIAQIENTSDTPMIPGPVSIYKDGDFVGDGVLGRTEIGQITELVYGTDLSVGLVAENLPKKIVANSVNIGEDNEILVNQSTTTKTKWVLSNQDSLQREFLLRVPISSKNIAPEPQRKNGNIAIFELSCPPASSVDLTTSSIKQADARYSLADINQKTIAIWKKDSAEIDSDLLVRLAKIFAQKEALAKLESQFSKAEQLKTQVTREQNRITNIIKVLKPESVTAEPYLKKLADSEIELQAAVEKGDDLLRQVQEAKDLLIELQQSPIVKGND